MSQVAVSWRSLARHLKPAEIIRDFFVLIALGSLAAFIILFTGRVIFDNLVHEGSLTYSARQVDARPGQGDLEITSYQDGGIAPSSGARDIAALQRTIDTSILTFPRGELADASALYRDAVRSGSLCDNGIALDEATAAAMSARVGDEVTLWWPADSTARPALVRVCALLNPWHPGASTGARGYVVTSVELVESVQPRALSTKAGNITSYWNTDVPVGSTVKGQAVRNVLATNTGWSAFVVAVTLVGLALWSFGVLRVWSAFRASLDAPWRVLRRLGVRPAVPPLFVSVIIAIMAAGASCASAVVARAFLLAWTSLYVTSLEIWLVASVLIAVALMVTASLVSISVRRA